MIEEQEKSKSENKKIIKSNISITNKKEQISGGNVIPGFPLEEKNIDENFISSNKYLMNNGNGINEINISKNNENISQKNENNSNDNNNINNNLINSQKNESIASSSKKNSVKDDIIMNNSNINNLKNNNEIKNHSYLLKFSPETSDKTEDKVYETDKKKKKNHLLLQIKN